MKRMSLKFSVKFNHLHIFFSKSALRLLTRQCRYHSDFFCPWKWYCKSRNNETRVKTTHRQKRDMPPDILLSFPSFLKTQNSIEKIYSWSKVGHKYNNKSQSNNECIFMIHSSVRIRICWTPFLEINHE